MKYMQNKALAGTTLNAGKPYKGDENGVFVMEDEHAARVAGTHGWREVEAVVPVMPVTDPTAALRARVAEVPPAALTPTEAPAVTPGEGGSESGEGLAAEKDEAQEGPVLAGLTKAQLLDVAEQYAIELTSADKALRVDDLRALIDKALYGVES